MKQQHGFTLIEVLVTTFVAGVGLLTAAGLQIVSKKANFEAVQRTAATGYAKEILSRMRANTGQLANYLTADATRLIAPSVDCSNASCTDDALAAYDLWVWGQSVSGVHETDNEGASSGGLVSPSACVQGSANGLYTIAIAWRSQTPAATADASDAADPNNNSCGRSAVNDPYRDADSGMDYRRVLVIEAYIASPGST